MHNRLRSQARPLPPVDELPSVCSNSTRSIEKIRLTHEGIQHRFSLSNCYPSFVRRAFSPRAIIATVNATIGHIISKAQRMWDASPVRRRKRRNLSLHHDNPAVVSGPSLGEYVGRVASTRVDVSCSEQAMLDDI